MTLSKPRFVYAVEGTPPHWPEHWQFPSPLPPGWPRDPVAHSCSVFLSNSHLGTRVKALWFDTDGDGLDAVTGQRCHIQLHDDAGIIPFALWDDASATPRLYRDWLGEIVLLDPEQYGVHVMLKPTRTPSRVDLCIYGWLGTDKSATEWGV